MQSKKKATMNDFIRSETFLLLCLCLVASVTTNHPSDLVVVRVGDSVVFRCPRQSNDNDNEETVCSIWTHYPSDVKTHHGFGEKELNNCEDGIHEDYSKRFQVETNANEAILNITNIKPDDAGKYECLDYHTGTEIITTEIIVLDENGPKCSSDSYTEFDARNRNRPTGQKWDRMQLQCAVAFNGSLNSNECILEWRIAGQRNGLRSDCNVSDGVVTSTLTLDRASHINGTSYICVVKESSANEQFSCETDEIFISSAENEVAPMSVSDPLKPFPWKFDKKSKKFLTDLILRSMLKRTKKEPRQILDWQRQTLHQVSQLVQVQEQLLKVEKARLRLEREKVR